MLQVVQYQKDGSMKLVELPAPECPRAGVLVRTEYSLISAGTEKTSVENAQVSMLQRAKRQPDQVKVVLDTLKKDGLINTYKKVKSKLDAYKLLGYSASGVVVESDCDEFMPGDRVACGGASLAVHAEYIAIPKNLAVKVEDGVSMRDACYATVGSIAMQGFRQAEPALSETVAVIGLGLLGQITVQLLKAAGCRVIGLDINEKLFAKAKEYGCDKVFVSSRDSIESIKAYSRGQGCDSVIITASTSSNDPIELALELARKKGKVVVVGGIGMNIPRGPFYLKEIDLRISCSYGPGRYDTEYEVHGHDYPYAYVRWTEKRNMQAILDLIAMGKLEVGSMTSHEIDLKDAERAYDIITGKVKEEYLGIVLKYPAKDEKPNRVVKLAAKGDKQADVKIGFIGAGSFAQNYLLPNLKNSGADFVSVSTSTPSNAETVGRQFNFSECTTDSMGMIKDKRINAIFCASRHDSHGKYVAESVKAGKMVFVEKPLALNHEELAEIDKAVDEKKGKVMVGFNRRFSDSFKKIKEFFGQRHDPMAIMYRVHAGFIPKGHWSQTDENGGRIIGEACHFIDCMVYLTDSLPKRVYAEAISSDNVEGKNHDNVMITIKFEDGSIGSLQYLANGDKSLPKEYMEAYCDQSTAIMKNFEEVELRRNKKVSKHKFDGKKGHKEEMLETYKSMREGTEMPISYEAIRRITLATFAAEEAIATGMPQDLD